MVLTRVSSNELGGGKAFRRTAQSVRAVVGALVEADIVHLHLGRKVLAVLHAVGERALAVGVGAVVADPAGRAGLSWTGLRHAPSVRQRGVQDQIHRLLLLTSRKRKRIREREKEKRRKRGREVYILSSHLWNDRPRLLLQGGAVDAQQHLSVQVPVEVPSAARLPFDAVGVVVLEVGRVQVYDSIHK